jgi:hypothetical protein
MGKITEALRFKNNKWYYGLSFSNNLAQIHNPDHSRNDQQYALICTTPLFYKLAPTCFGSSLPSSGSFLDHAELFA